MTEPGTHPEDECHRCGGPNLPWHAPSPLWNAVMRGGAIVGEEEFGIICPTCFMVLAEERGIAEAWRLDARVVHVDLELVTPSGRTWDAEADLWRSSPDVLIALRDALDDAIRRAYCEPIIAPVTGENPEEVRAMATAAIITSPSRMRHLAGIQAAAWAVVEERVDA